MVTGDDKMWEGLKKFKKKLKRENEENFTVAEASLHFFDLSLITYFRHLRIHLFDMI
jgi:hypothetical protein